MELINTIFYWLLSALVNIILFGAIFGMLVWGICQALSKNHYSNPKVPTDNQTTTNPDTQFTIHIRVEEKK